jgi:hypothetical protein
MQNEQEWFADLEPAFDLARTQGKAVLIEFQREECAGCMKMLAKTFADPDVQRELFQWFVPVRQDIQKNREVRSRFSAYWTPSFYFLDYHGKVQYQFNGYQGVEDFRVLLRLGKTAVELPRGRYLQVIDLMDDGLKLFPDNPRAAAMLLNRGIAEYLLGKEKSSFRGAMREIVEAYPESLEARMWPWMDRE